MDNRIDIDKSVLRWAIVESRIPYEYIETRNQLLIEVMNGDKKPTFIQLKGISEFLKVPFGYFFLKTPPKEDQFRVEFRTLNNKINSNISKNLKDTIMDMDFKKEWFSEYKKNNGYDEFKTYNKFDLNKYKESANYLRDELKLGMDWQLDCKKTIDAFTLIRTKIENNGVLVMLNGVVGNNNSRILDINEFRGFVLKDKYAPIIFINRNDSEAGMLFTLLHEYVHLLSNFDTDDILLNYFNQTELERKINKIVAEFLMPEEYLVNRFSPTLDHFNQINNLARKFKTSTTVVAIQAFNQGLITANEQEQIMREAMDNYGRSRAKRENEGGNFYYTTMNRMSKQFYTTVIHQAEGGKVSFTDAYKLLTLKGKTYDNFKKIVENKMYE